MKLHKVAVREECGVFLLSISFGATGYESERVVSVSLPARSSKEDLRRSLAGLYAVLGVDIEAIDVGASPA